MSLSDEARVKQLQGFFEGREAIYIEYGALRVKVSKIKGDPAELSIRAEVKEIPAAGFPVGSFSEIPRRGRKPLRWNIVGGYLTAFSENRWCMGYGGWSLFFAPKIVDGILSLVRQFPDNLDSHQRYVEVCRYLQVHKAYQPTQQVFAGDSSIPHPRSRVKAPMKSVEILEKELAEAEAQEVEAFKEFRRDSNSGAEEEWLNVMENRQRLAEELSKRKVN